MATKKNSDAGFLMQGSILAVASIISRIVGLIYRIPLTSIIGKTGNDYYGTAYEIYNIILIISSYSIPLAVSKLVAARMAVGETKNAFRVLKGSLLFAFVSGGIAMCVVYFGAEWLTGTLLKTPYSVIALKVLAPVLLIVAVLGVFRGFFQGLNTMVPSALSQIGEQIINAIISVAAAYFLFSYGSRIGGVLGDKENYAAAYGAAGGTLGTAVGAVFALGFMVVLFLLFYPRFKKKLIRDHSRNVEDYRSIAGILIFTIIPVLLSTTIYNVSSIIDQMIFKNMAVSLGYESSQISQWWGVYTGQYKVLINVPISIASAMAASSVVSLTTAYKSGDMKTVRMRIHSATRFIMIIAFPCTVGLMALASPINMLLFSDSDPTSGYMMLVGGVAVIFYSLSTLSNGLLQGIDRLKIPVRNAAIALVAQAVLLVWLLLFPRLHIYAVIIANAFYAFLMCLLNNLALRKYSGAKQNFMSTYFKPLFSSALMGVAVFLIYKALYAICHVNSLSTILAIMAGVVLYFVLMLMIGGIKKRDIRRLPKGKQILAVLERLHLL